jgi:hypothetical protein
MTTPCNECLIFAICKNKDIIEVIRDCQIIKNHLHESSRVLNKEKLEAFSTIMGRTLTRVGGEYRII